SERASWVIQMLTKEHLDSLEQFFQHNNFAQINEMKSIATHLNITDCYVRTWFRYRLFKETAIRLRRRYLPFVAA
ncbi:unnamed protein product, partial [Rotaria sordida]